MNLNSKSSTYRFIAISWGKEFYYRFSNYLIASLFNNHTLNFLKNDKNKYHFYFYLDQTSLEKFHKIPVIENNLALLNIHLIDIASLFSQEHKYNNMTKCHTDFINKYIEIGDVGVFLHPDFIISDHFIENLLLYSQMKDVVVNDIIRLDETLVKENLNLISNQNQIAISSLNLAKWGIKLIHDYTQIRFWGNKKSTSWPVNLYFKDENTSNLLVKSFGLHTLAVRFRVKPNGFGSFDGDLLPKMFENIEDSILVIPDNYKICIFDVCNAKLKVGKSLNQKFSYLRIAYIFSKYFSEIKTRKIFLKHTIKWVCSNQYTDWDNLEKKANQVVRRINFWLKYLNKRWISSILTPFYKKSIWFEEPYKLEEGDKH